jgi:hypothetical protein
VFHCGTAEAWLKKSIGIGVSSRHVIAIGRSPVWLTYVADPTNRLRRRAELVLLLLAYEQEHGARAIEITSD